MPSLKDPMMSDTTTTSGGPVARAAAFDLMRDLAVEIIGVHPEEFAETSSFIDDMYVDSLDLVEIIMAMEDELDFRVSEEQLEGVVTVADALDLVMDPSRHLPR